MPGAFDTRCLIVIETLKQIENGLFLAGRALGRKPIHVHRLIYSVYAAL